MNIVSSSIHTFPFVAIPSDEATAMVVLELFIPPFSVEVLSPSITAHSPGALRTIPPPVRVDINLPRYVPPLKQRVLPALTCVLLKAAWRLQGKVLVPVPEADPVGDA
jgi:hypothetical protein